MPIDTFIAHCAPRDTFHAREAGLFRARATMAPAASQGAHCLRQMRVEASDSSRTGVKKNPMMNVPEEEKEDFQTRQADIDFVGTQLERCRQIQQSIERH